MVQPPPVDELLSTCTKLLHKKSLAFPVHDFLVMICSHDEGRYRSNVVTFLVDRIKECGLVSSHGNGTMLAALFNVLALILNEDVVARKAASKSGFLKIASDIFYQWDSSLGQGEKGQSALGLSSKFADIHEQKGFVVDCPTESHLEALLSAKSLATYGDQVGNMSRSVACVIHLTPSGLTMASPFLLGVTVLALHRSSS
ncbi:hypothetical protein KIW84_074179 [Lathyrus oleraceus]|uniref:Uncharacterized protein n=1 Tax=Pisum sativum TaxID=3888 RepID=A0A9D4VT28_PEA|nr:hypothetical protein KIW84_074179 [Pisum sativum]